MSPTVLHLPRDWLPLIRHSWLLLQEMAAAKVKAAEQQAAKAAAEAAALAPARQLAAALILKGYRMTLPEVHVGARKPRIDPADGSLHWPVLLLYPETGQQDVIEDWHEGDAVADHLDVVSGRDTHIGQWRGYWRF